MTNDTLAPLVEGKFDLKELIHATAAEANLPLSEVDHAVKTALSLLATKIIELGYAELNHFGSFHLRKLSGESGTDPQGNEYKVGERITVDFNPFKRFRDELESKTGIPAIL